MVLGIKTPTVQEVARPTTPLGIKATPLVTAKGTTLPKGYFSTLSKAEQAAFAQGGTPSLQKFHETHLKSDSGTFVPTIDYIKIPDGYISKTEFNVLSATEQNIVKDKGTAGLNIFYTTHLKSDVGKFVPVADYVKISGGYYSKADYTGLSSTEKNILTEQGTSGLNSFYKTHLKSESGVFVPKSDFIKTFDGYVSKSDFSKLSVAEQNILKDKGRSGLEDFYTTHLAVERYVTTPSEFEKVPDTTKLKTVFVPKTDYIQIDRKTTIDLPGADKITGLAKTTIEPTYIPKFEWGELTKDEQVEFRQTGHIAPYMEVGGERIKVSTWNKMTIGEQLTSMLGRRPSPNEYYSYGKQVGVFKDVWTVSPGYGTKGASGYWTKDKVYAGRSYRAEYGIAKLAWEDLRTVGEFIIPATRATRADVSIRDIAPLEWFSTAATVVPVVGYGLKAVGITARAISGALGTTRFFATVGKIGAKIPVVSQAAKGVAYVASNPFALSPAHQVPRLAFKVVSAGGKLGFRVLGVTSAQAVRGVTSLGSKIFGTSGVSSILGTKGSSILTGAMKGIRSSITGLAYKGKVLMYSPITGRTTLQQVSRTMPSRAGYSFAVSTKAQPFVKLPVDRTVQQLLTGGKVSTLQSRISAYFKRGVGYGTPTQRYDLQGILGGGRTQFSVARIRFTPATGVGISYPFGFAGGQPIAVSKGLVPTEVATKPSGLWSRIKGIFTRGKTEAPSPITGEVLYKQAEPIFDIESITGVSSRSPLVTITRPSTGVSPAIVREAAGKIYRVPISVRSRLGIRPIVTAGFTPITVTIPISIMGVSPDVERAAEISMIEGIQPSVSPDVQHAIEAKIQPAVKVVTVAQTVVGQIMGTSSQAVRSISPISSIIVPDKKVKKEKKKIEVSKKKKVKDEELEAITGARPDIVARLPVFGRWVLPEDLRAEYSRGRVVEKRRKFRYGVRAKSKVLGSKHELGNSSIGKTQKAIV